MLYFNSAKLEAMEGKSVIKRFLSWTANIMLLLLMALVFLIGHSLLEANSHPQKSPSIMGYCITPVLTSSMSPVIEPGDMIITRIMTPDKIKIGDIITYKASEDILITHRVVKILQQQEQIMFQTKGDENNTEDQRLVSKDQLVGSFNYRIPYGGYFLKFVKSTVGFVIVIVLPIGLIIGCELKKIVSEWIKEESSKGSSGVKTSGNL